MIARVFLAGVVVLGLAFSATAQTTRPATQPTTRPVAKPTSQPTTIPAAMADSLARFAPAGAVFFVERAGHEAIEDAFENSNLGAAFHEPALTDFIYQFLRDHLYETFAEEAFDIDDLLENDRLRTMQDHLLSTVWFKPTALFMLPRPSGPDDSWSPRQNFGLICALPPAERKEVRAALDTLMKDCIGGEDANRYAFAWTTGTLTWTGVAYSDDLDELPSETGELEKTLADESVLLIGWTDKYVLVATSLAAADALDKGLSAGGRDSLAMTADFQTVMKKTDTANWAFRWFVNIQAAKTMVKDEDDDEDEPEDRIMAALGLNKVRAVGGMMGYEKKTVAYRTYVLSPQNDGGLLGLFARDGSYKPALNMVPRDSVFALAGQVDSKAAAAMIRAMVPGAVDASKQAAKRRQQWLEAVDAMERGDDEVAVPPWEEEDADDEAELPEEVVAALKNMDDILSNFSGHAGVFVGPMSMEKLEEEDGPPLGLVLGMKSEKAALDALASIRELVVNLGDGNARRVRDDGEAKPAKTHRGVVIHSLGRSAYAAALDDRLLISPSPEAVRQAIDTAKDEGSGGFAKESKGEAYRAAAGEGAGIFFLDFGSLAKSFWPMLREHAPEEWRLPDTEAMVKHLGPEIAVLKPDPDGLLLQCTGLVPFSTHVMGAQGLMMLMWFGHFMW